MKKPKRGGGHLDFLIVPNRDWKGAKFKSSKASKVVVQAAKETRKKRQYKLVKKSDGAYVIVTSKASGHLISKFKVGNSVQLRKLRKFSLSPKQGTVSPEKILKAI